MKCEFDITTTFNNNIKTCNRHEWTEIRSETFLIRIYIYQINEPIKYVNIMPMYHRNSTHAQKHVFDKQPRGEWVLLSDIFPLRNLLCT